MALKAQEALEVIEKLGESPYSAEEHFKSWEELGEGEGKEERRDRERLIRKFHKVRSIPKKIPADTLETAFYNSFLAPAGAPDYNNLKNIKYDHFPTLISAYKRAFKTNSIHSRDRCTFLFDLSSEEALVTDFSYDLSKQGFSDYIDAISFMALVANYVSIGTQQADKIAVFLNKPALLKRALQYVKTYNKTNICNLRFFYGCVMLLGLSCSGDTGDGAQGSGEQRNEEQGDDEQRNDEQANSAQFRADIVATIESVWIRYWEQREVSRDFLSFYYFIRYRFQQIKVFEPFLEKTEPKIREHMISSTGFQFIQKVLNKTDLDPMDTHSLAFSIRSVQEEWDDHRYQMSIEVDTYQIPGWKIRIDMPSPRYHVHFDPGLFSSNSREMLKEIGWEQNPVEPDRFPELFTALSEYMGIEWNIKWGHGYTSIPRSHKKVEKWFKERCFDKE